MKKDVMIAGRADPALKKRFKDALKRARGMKAESDFIRDCAAALIDHTDKGETLAQPLKFLTEEHKRALIRSGFDI